MKGGLLATLIAVSVLSTLGVGCSTARPIPSSRQGFFARLNDPARGGATRRAYPSEGSDRPAVEVTESDLRWPLEQVAITSSYGKRGRVFHEGLDLKASTGTPVLAAQDGTVIYAGRKIRGYGNMVVIRHSPALSTVYAHNSRLLVKAGQLVRPGQRIALSGNTGRSSGPHLHFEVRHGTSPVNPLQFLPEPSVATQPKVVASQAVHTKRRKAVASSKRRRLARSPAAEIPLENEEL